jgi:glycosyltransferase involved in cell wall biosynthesis
VNTPSLSVVIPNFNHAQYLPRCLEAMLRQSVQPAEIIVMDDASTDNSIEVIEVIARKSRIVRLVRNERNLGVVANVNRGIDQARGDYVFSAAADDEIVPGFFEKSLSLLAKHPQAALSCTIGDYREADTGVNWHWGVGVADRPTYFTPAELVEVERKGRFYIPPHSVIFRKEALREAGGLRPELKYTCDWFAMYIAGFRHGICFVPEPLAVFHILPDSYYQRNRRKTVEHRKVIRALLDALSESENGEPAELIRRAGSLHLYGWPALRDVLVNRPHRRFLTALFAFRAVQHSTRVTLKRLMPVSFVKWYLRRADYQSRDAVVLPGSDARN